MSEYTSEEIKHHVKTYVMVFIALAALTVVTVAISYLDLTVGPAVLLALIVASIKGSLVACYFMHLISEKVTIYWTLLVTLAFFLVLMFVPLSTMLHRQKYSMSLKSFHILFITLSTITVVWFGIWELNQSVFIAMVSFLTGVGLIYYGFRVLKKFRTIS